MNIKFYLLRSKIWFFSICYFLLQIPSVSHAQPIGWSNISSFVITENSGNTLTDYQLRLEINTQSLIAANTLLAGGEDLRFGSDCQGSFLYNHWIESGLNTSTTVVWVKIDNLPASGSKTIYMYHGNPLASNASFIPGTFFGPHSSTDSVNSGTPGGVENSQRGFRFSPNEDILVTHFGKNEPNGTPRYVTLFDYVNQNIISQLVVNGPATQYSYGNLSNPVWLTQNTQYLLELYQGTGDGYYFGNSTQIGEHLTYYDMRYCNSCTQNTFPTSFLEGYQYGYPDLYYFTKNNVSPAPSVVASALIEICNGLDDDCDGLIDEGVLTTFYADVDTDSYGDPSSSTQSCLVSLPGYVTDNTDCNDANPGIYPGATETCNSIDDDCNGLTDDGLLFTTFYADTDGDTYGDPSNLTTSCEGSLAGYVTDNSDCNDGSIAVNPGVTEVCNNLIDDNCDGQTDENCITYTYYLDNDLDGYGDPAVTTISSNPLPPTGYVADNTDCDDNNIAVNPGATEICNGIDDNCDGITDLGSILAAGPIAGPGAQCMAVQTGSATFSIAAVPGANSYSWTVPSTMNILSGQGTTSIFVSWTPFAVHDGIVGNITVSPVDNCGNGQSSSLAIDINYTSPVRPSSISGPVKLCPGDIGTYSVFAVARASSYQWNLPAGLTITSGTGTNVIEVSADNTFAGGTITCSAVNVCGASPVRTRTTTLNTPATPTAISGFANGLCGATGVAYLVALLPMASGYTWSVPAGATIMDGQGTNSILVDFDANFTSGAITVTGNNGCGDGPARSLTVKGAPGIASPIIGDISICNGQVNVKYEVNTVTGAGNYQWTVPTGVTLVSGQGTKEIFVNYGATTASGLQVSVITSNSCGSSIARVLNGIVVNPGNCIRFGETGNDEVLSLYPNPAHSNTLLRFKMINPSPYQLNLTDVSGRLIYSQKGSSNIGMNQIEMSVEQYASGIYFVELQTEGLTKSVKLIIE
ncbi:MAG: DUF2341 domain-containing protein [Bacteroidetes bacterium]|nr:DUF2341 domain-containing protein [Bacteroidota bacterium]